MCLDGTCYDTCETDDDCTNGLTCQHCTCQVPAQKICGDVLSSDIEDYVVECRDTSCSTSLSFAFNSVDLSGLSNINSYNTTYSRGHPSLTYCCQSGRNCDDGYSGCEPNCTACCDMTQCEEWDEYFVASNQFSCCIQGRCALVVINVPDLYVDESPAGQYNFKTIDWSLFDFTTTSYTSAQLKAGRTLDRDLNFTSCSATGTVDSGLPCGISVIHNSSSGNCPSACPNKRTPKRAKR